eukprot:4219305-Amphidinium_carterae.1
MRPWRMRAPGKWKPRAIARMREAARNLLPSLPTDNKETEPGGSVPALLCLPLSCSSRSGEGWTASGPGGSWCRSAATLDCSLRYQLSFPEALCTECCQKAMASERVLPSPKTPCLFPVRYHFGSSLVLLGPGGAGAPDQNAQGAFHGWKAVTMDMARPYPALEHLEVLYANETRVYPMSSVYQLVSVTDDATADQRRAQERVLLFEYARIPNPD